MQNNNNNLTNANFLGEISCLPNKGYLLTTLSLHYANVRPLSKEVGKRVCAKVQASQVLDEFDTNILREMLRLYSPTEMYEGQDNTIWKGLFFHQVTGGHL